MNYPLSHINRQTSHGVGVRRFNSSAEVAHITEMHRDNYYLFCVIQKGSMVISVDFKTFTLGSHSLGIILPGQLHQFQRGTDLGGWFMFIDGALIDDNHKLALTHYDFAQRPLPIDEVREAELLALFPMLERRLDTPQSHDFARCIVDVYADILGENDIVANPNPRYAEIIQQFRQLLEQHITSNRLPSFYADRLNVTTGYLNEIVTACTGFSTRQYIQNEMMLRAKREIAYTTRNIQEIAYALGFDEYPYFSKLFTKAVGVSPAAFRANHGERENH